MQGNILWHYDALNFGKVTIYLVLGLCCLLSHQSAIAQPGISNADSSDYWVIELLQFTHRPAAEVFIERLAKKHFQADIITVEAGGDTSYRTQTPLFPSFSAAKHYRNLLKEKTNLHNSHLVIQGPLQATDVGWRIDLIRYQSRAEAEAFVGRLGNKGFEAVIVALDMSGKSLFQTRTPQFTDVSTARDYRDRLKRATNILDHHLQIVFPSTHRLATTSTGQEEAVDTLDKEVSSKSVSGQKNVVAVSPSNVVKEQELTVESSRSIEPAAGSEAALSVASGAISDVTSWFPDWHVYGSNTWRTDGYGSKGNLAATPYRFSRAHSYDELSLNFDRSFSPYHRISGQISGLAYNDSLYRSPYPGTVLERVNLRQENGEFLIPYRAEAGDFFAYQSYRTIQRSLKGGRIEFQPQWGGSTHHSLEFFSGSATPTWETFQYPDDFSNGASWLIQNPLIGAVSANLVFNHKQSNGAASAGLKQYVSSLAWEKRASFLGQNLVLEAEAGRFVGDHSVVAAGVANMHRQGNGFFGQISGSFIALPQLSYRIRGEAYEQDYLPNGASIQSDRNSQEAYLTWRSQSGLSISGRFQHYHTAWQTTDPADAITYGGNISGIIPVLGGLSGSIDAFISNNENRSLSVNTVSRSVSANLSKALSPNLSARAGLFYSANRDRNNLATGRNQTVQYSGGVDYRFTLAGLNGSLSPGFIARRMYQQPAAGRWDYNPTLNSSLIYGNHQLSVALSKQDQSSPLATGGVDTMTAGLNYRYTKQQFIIGLDANWYDRQPDSAATVWTNAWRLGAYLTYNFDKPVKQVAMAAPQSVTDAAPETPAIERVQFDIARVRPGMKRSEAEALVAGAGLGKASEQAGVLIWYARIFRDVIENQRLALELSGDRVARAAVIIDPQSALDVAGIRNLFERMQRELLAVYGQPAAFFEQGDFTPNLATELAAGRFIRVMEWKRDGGVLRFGIPRRLDGQIRMELQFAPGFASLKDTLWSMEQVQ